MTRPLVLARPDRYPPWARRLSRSFCRPPGGIPSDLGDVDSVWIDATDLQPLQVAREVVGVDPSIQTIVVSPPEDRGIHERAMLFTPGLGEVWFMGPDEVGADSLDRAREVTEKRRRYRETRGKAGQILGEFKRGRPRRAVVSDAYLAALLQVLPDPVVSVDDEDRVVSWSPASERCFGTADINVLGRPVADVLGPEDPGALHDALERGREGPTSLDVVVASPDGPLTMEAVITPVSAGGFNVRVVVLRDVTRERESMARLKHEIELRSRSYAAMSHEIRTPINAIMGYNELLRLGAGGEDKRDDYLERSQRAAAHLLALLNDVLDLSKLESGMIEVEREPTRIQDIAQDLASTLEPLARERGAPLEIDCDAAAGEMNTDARRLSQILINLVSNALKFGEGRPVTVRCRRTADAVVFEVEDRGKGIAPDQQDRIFEEFVQVSDSDEGTGLGLPISRKLADLLGGTLTVESEPGVGSVFQVRIPLDPERRPAPRSAGAERAARMPAARRDAGRAG